jgi:hypothetical protein
MRGDDILSVIFLAFICIVIAGITWKLAPSQLVVPSFVLISVCLWIAYDYMMLKRYQTYDAKLHDDSAIIEQKLADLNFASLTDEEPDDSQPGAVLDETITKTQQNQIDIDIHNNVDLRSIHKEMGCSGDNQMANRMKYMAMQAKASIDSRANWNKYSFQPFIEEELRESEERCWWENNDVLNSVF